MILALVREVPGSTPGQAQKNTFGLGDDVGWISTFCIWWIWFFFRRGLVTAIDVLLTQNVVFVVICNVLIDSLYMPVNR